MSGETARWVRRQMDYVEANLDQFPSYRFYRGIVGPEALREREKFQFKGNLVGNSAEPLTAARDRGHLNVTFHHNWYFNVDQRMPRMRFGNAHVFNLLADSSAGRGLMALSREGVVATSGAAVRVDQAWFTGLQVPASIQVGTEAVGTVLVRNSINYDAVTGVAARYDTLQAAPGVVFAWNQPDARTGIAGWPAADPEVLPAGYTAPGRSLANYLDPAEDLRTHLAWVGVVVPADAAEAELWRARWVSIGP
jgi:pectate lyase